MRTGILATLLALVVTTTSGGAPLGRTVAQARAELRAFRPRVRWHPVLQLDINCDGLRDDVFTGRTSGHFYVAAVLAGASPRKISITGFRLHGESQDSFCGEPTLLEKESMDYDPAEPVGETPEGFQRSSDCFGLHIVAGECDSFHLFWNHQENKLDWWRL